MVRLLVLTLMCSFALGCSRPKSGNSFSTVTIQVPKGLNKIGALAAMPSDRKACYGINVTGPAIPEKRGNVCSPLTGLVGGFAEPGATLEMQVPKGRDRKIELFAFLQDVGQNIPCPLFAAAMTVKQTTNTYLVGTAYGIDMSEEVTVVEITADFPGAANHIAQQQSLPQTCGMVADGQNRPGFYISGGDQTAAGGGVKVIGRVGRATGQQTASGGGFRMVTQ